MRLVHLADLHLGFKAYNRTNDRGINLREADVFKAFKEALAKTKTIAPDLLLIAGDVFHVSHPRNIAVLQAQRQLQEFVQSTGIETIVIAGNHESIRSKDNQCILELFGLIDGVKVVCNQPEVILNRSEEIRVVCLPHNCLSEVSDLDLRPDREFRFNLLMLHGTVNEKLVNDYGGYTIPDRLLDMDWDYVACGHFHSFTHINKYIYYAGAIERTSNDIWKEAKEEKGFIEFDLDHKKAQFHPLKTRTTIDLPVIDALNKTIEEIDHLLLDQVNQTDISDALVRQKVINLSKSLQRQLNYRQIRNFQNAALHYLFDPRPPEANPDQKLWQSIEPVNGFLEEVQEFLQNRATLKNLCPETFAKQGLEYLQRLPS